ncbi:hypothetical protein ACN2WE_04920 [Streptomyces sp. cg28]
MQQSSGRLEGRAALGDEDLRGTDPLGRGERHAFAPHCTLDCHPVQIRVR